MPRNAAATVPAGPTTTPLEELLDRGRSQGHLSLNEVRKAFQEAGITPTQGRSILRELTDAGVRLASEDEAEATPIKKGTASVKKAKPSRAKAAAEPAKPTGSKAKAATAEPAKVAAEPVDTEPA